MLTRVINLLIEKKLISSSNIIKILKDGMSNQLVDGFEGSQPFIKFEDFNNLSNDEMRKLIEKEKKNLLKNIKI